MQSAIDHFPTPAYQRKLFKVANPSRGFANLSICFIKRPCLKFWFLSRVDSLFTIKDRHWWKLAARLHLKSRITKRVAYFCMGAYNHKWFLKSKWVPIFIEELFSMGAYYPDFTLLMCWFAWESCGRQWGGSAEWVVHVDVHEERFVLWVAATQLLQSMADMVCLMEKLWRSCGVHHQC